MSNEIKFTLPPMTEGQDSWRMSICPPPVFTVVEQSRFRQFVYRTLMWVSDQAESVWHWTYHKARPFGPRHRVDEVRPGLYSFTVKRYNHVPPDLPPPIIKP